MKTRLLVVALALALTAIAVPAIADHVLEPSAPVTGVFLHLYQYPDPKGTTLACDGTDVVTFADVRVEGMVFAEATPSEHWDERLTLWVVTQGPFGRERVAYDWDVTWRHANVPPHGIRFESHQTNQSLSNFPAGTVLRITNTVMGLESDVVVTDSCTFAVG